MDPSLELLGVGAYLPAVRPVRELVLDAGGDPARFDGWPNTCVASEEEQPSVMAARALASALEKSEVSAAELSLIVSCGFSRDYLPTWSLSTEVMQKLSAPSTCLGLDTTIGCVGVLAALELVRGWLATNGGGYAAIVAAEKWSQTIDRKDGLPGLWANGDGAGAAVVAMGVPCRPVARYRGAVFSSNADFNGLVLVKYGGTRHPIAPPGADPFTRQVRQIAPNELWASYREGYARALRGLGARFAQNPRRLVCNQIAPRFVATIGELAGVPTDRVCRTGAEYGHVGSSDILLGLMQLSHASAFDGPVALAGSTPYAFGAALVEPV